MSIAPCITDTDVESRPCASRPWRHIVACGDSRLQHPVIVELQRCIQALLRIGVEAVKKRVAVRVIVRRKLSFDVRKGNIPADPDIQAGENRPIDDVLKRGNYDLLAHRGTDVERIRVVVLAPG